MYNESKTNSNDANYKKYKQREVEGPQIVHGFLSVKAVLSHLEEVRKRSRILTTVLLSKDLYILYIRRVHKTSK